MKKIYIFFFLIFSCLFAGNAFSIEKKNIDFFDADIFSLAKKKENAFDASSSVYVLTSEDIRRSGVTSIPEALRMVPGIQVARQAGNSWAVSSRGLNHQYASKLLVLIDGLTIYTPIFSGTFWDNHDYVMEDIDRIEVIRGPGGSVWGANAMNGIINIITKSAAQTQGSYLSQTFGNNDKSITEARYGGKTENLNLYKVYAKHAVRGDFQRARDGTTNADGTVNIVGSGSNHDGIVGTKVGFRYEFSSLKDDVLTLHGDFFNNKSRNYFQGFDYSGGNTDKENEGGNIVLNWNRTIDKKSSISLQSYLYYDRNNIQVVDFKEKTADIDFQHFYNFSERNQFVWGLGYRQIRDSIETRLVNSDQGSFIPLQYLPDERNIGVYSAFIQDKIGIIEDELFLTIGSKFEINEQTGFEYQPNARLTYFPSRNQTLWAAVSRAIRVPTRGEDSVEIRIDPDTLVTKGDPSSLAETVISYEVGYRVKPTSTTLLDVSVFFNEYSNLGTFDADVSAGVPGIPTASNTGRAETFGGEFTGKWQATNSLRFEVGYDFLKTDIKFNADSNEADPDASALNADKLSFFENMSPRNQFRIRAFYNLTPRIEIDNLIYYVDYLERRIPEESDVPSYVRWDLRLGYFITRNLDLSFGVQNILDDRHNEFGPGLFNNRIEVGRTFYGKAVLQF